MKKSYIVPIIALVLTVATTVMAAETAPPEIVATKAIGQLGQEMRKKLVDSMQKNGPAGSITVCAKDAPTIAARIENELGVTIKRTSLKVRNPRNAPDAKEQELLEFLAASSLASKQLTPGIKMFPNDPRRFYKVIMVEQVCLKCHGDATTMNEEVRKEVRGTYPDDKAIGYNAGDLRGIISVTVK